MSGGNTGIGAAIARGLLAEGYDVISLSRRKPDWSHPKLTSREVDLLDATATRQAATEIAAKVAITHVVHNAGAIRAKLLEEVVDEDVGALAQLHFGAAIALAQAALPGMKQARFGRIVLLSSRAALGAATRTVYSATKAGIIGMARTWALELAPFGITVNVVAPGPIARYRDVRERDVAGIRTRKEAGAVDSARPPRQIRRRRARGQFLQFTGCRLHHRADAVCLRRSQHRINFHLAR